MPIPVRHLMERLHLAYVHAVAARAGTTCTIYDQDYGLDVVINDVVNITDARGRRTFEATGVLFHCQLKATTTCQKRGGFVLYDMDVDAYNKLIRWRGASPCYLLLFHLPNDEMEWVNLSEEQLLLKKCCYWILLRGSESHNTSTERIQIPESNLFTPDVVRELLARQESVQPT